MTPICLAITTFILGTGTPFQRAEALYASAQGMVADFELEVSGRGSAIGTIEIRRPALQRIKMTVDGVSAEFVQSPEARVAFLHNDKEYVWYPKSMVLSEPPPEAGFLMRWADPIFLFTAPLSKVSPEKMWTSGGTDTVGGLKTDIIALRDPKAPGSDLGLSLWIDGRGRILRIKTVAQTADGKITGLMSFKSVSTTAPPESSFKVVLPRGYVAAKPPRTLETSAPGEPVAMGKCVRWPGGQAADLTRAPGLGPVVALFTSADLEEPVVPLDEVQKIVDALKTLKIRFIQIWVGKQPQKTEPAWECFWDDKGEIEHRIGAASTPTFLAFDKGTIKGGWIGWGEGDTEKVVEALTGALKYRN